MCRVGRAPSVAASCALVPVRLGRLLYLVYRLVNQVGSLRAMPVEVPRRILQVGLCLTEVAERALQLRMALAVHVSPAHDDGTTRYAILRKSPNGAARSQNGD